MLANNSPIRRWIDHWNSGEWGFTYSTKKKKRKKGLYKVRESWEKGDDEWIAYSENIRGFWAQREREREERIGYTEKLYSNFKKRLRFCNLFLAKLTSILAEKLGLPWPPCNIFGETEWQTINIIFIIQLWHTFFIYQNPITFLFRQKTFVEKNILTDICKMMSEKLCHEIHFFL